ncbi:MAG: chloride channel protein, partial [Pseudobdellovibrio sp.]
WPKKLTQPNISSMLLAGGAAGLASAFNTPLGGVVFAIEEMSKSHISSIRTAVFQAVILAGVLAQFFLGNYLYLGTAQYLHPSWHVLYQTVLVALVAGLLGAIFAESLYKINQWRMKKKFQQKILIALMFGFLFSALIWLCGLQVTGSGKSLMVNLLSNPESHVSLEVTVGRILGSLFTYSGGVIGGIFAPALSSGAAIGQFIAQSFEFINVKIMIMVGMVGFLTGITRTPFTSFVLVLEMSDSHEIIIYLMLASMVSNFVGKMINPKSFYEQVAHGLIHADKR